MFHTITNNFFFSARQGLVAALFIIFLGIIPIIAIVALLSYYARHNLKIRLKRPKASTYVPKFLQHAVSACKGVGASFRSSKPSCDESIPRDRNLEIRPAGLVSTTNSDGIIRSNTINKDSLEEKIDINIVKPPRCVSSKNTNKLKLNINIKNSINLSGSSDFLETPSSSVETAPIISVRDIAKKFDVAKNDQLSNLKSPLENS